MPTPKNLANNLKQLVNFVPKHKPPEKEDKDNFKKFLTNYNNILVLTGAGVSTESGIPDYRSEGVGLYARTTYKPILYSTFVKSQDARTRYWARNFVGWPRFSSVTPNKTHSRIAALEHLGIVTGVVTQNVDGLHSKAGSVDVIELHGNSYWVGCLDCKAKISRYDFQKTLQNLNPHVTATVDMIRPDGDVEINEEAIKNFVVPNCDHCGGILKPCVVFFGDNVPPARVQKVENKVKNCEALLILGTSLSTLSSYRIVEQAYDLCKFICMVNLGPTRGDKLADLLINAKCSDIFPIITL